MKSEAGCQHGAAVAVVARVVNVLQVHSGENTPPQVRVVVGFDNIFPAVVQRTIPDQEAEPAKSKIFLMVGGNAIGQEHAAQFVLLAAPFISR